MNQSKIFLVTTVLLILMATGVTAQETTAKATFAAGCFWCMEKPYDVLDGVISTTSGYAGGHLENPTYNQVTAGGTGHTEVVQVVYDPSKVSYEELLYVYWRNVDPLDGDGQFCDRGDSYRPAIYTHNAEQQRLAEASSSQIAGRFSEPLEVEIEPLDTFYPGEDYHQDYYQKNPIRYWFYRSSCGRDARLSDLWGDEAGGEIAQSGVE